MARSRYFVTPGTLGTTPKTGANGKSAVFAASASFTVINRLVGGSGSAFARDAASGHGWRWTAENDSAPRVNSQGFVVGSAGAVADDARFLDEDYKPPQRRSKGAGAPDEKEGPVGGGADGFASAYAAARAENDRKVELKAREAAERVNGKIDEIKASDNRAVRKILEVRRGAMAYSRANIHQNTLEKRMRDAEASRIRGLVGDGDVAGAAEAYMNRFRREGRSTLVYALGAYTGNREYRKVKVRRGGKWVTEKVEVTGADVTRRRMAARGLKLDPVTRLYVNTVGKHVTPTSVVQRRFEIYRRTINYSIGASRRYGVRKGLSMGSKRRKTLIRKENRRRNRRFVRRFQRKAQDVAISRAGRAAIRITVRSVVQAHRYRLSARRRGTGFLRSFGAAARYTHRYNVSKAREYAGIRARGGTRSTATRALLGEAGIAVARKTSLGRFVFGKAQPSRSSGKRSRSKKGRGGRSGLGKTSAQRSKAFRRAHSRGPRSVYSSYRTASAHRRMTGGRKPRGRRSSWTRPHKR